MIHTIYIMLTLCKAKQWFLWPLFPHANAMDARLAYLYIALSYHFRITPNGSLLKWWGYAQKWAHPP